MCMVRMATTIEFLSYRIELKKPAIAGFFTLAFHFLVTVSQNSL